MGDNINARNHNLAPMSPMISLITLMLLALPIALILSALSGSRFVADSALVITIIYAWVWLRFRPSQFVVHDRAIEIIWPLKRRQIARSDIMNVQLLDREALRKKIGWGFRVGAGGLWGGFGWLWTKRRGIVKMYVSRTDGLVWIEPKNDRPWLITPERPETFIKELLSQ